MFESVLFPNISLKIFQHNTGFMRPHAILLEPGHTEINTATCETGNSVILQNIKVNMRNYFPQ
jgi:hypothetical protein